MNIIINSNAGEELLNITINERGHIVSGDEKEFIKTAESLRNKEVDNYQLFYKEGTKMNDVNDFEQSQAFIEKAVMTLK